MLKLEGVSVNIGPTPILRDVSLQVPPGTTEAQLEQIVTRAREMDDAWYREGLRIGFEASGEAGKADRFEVASMLTIIPGDDAEQCADLMRAMLALYAGGMGAKDANFHFDVFDRMGWGGVATEVQELYLQGKKQEAAALIPLEMVEDIALVGPVDKIRDDLAKWKETCLTTVLLNGRADQLEMLADLING